MFSVTSGVANVGFLFSSREIGFTFFESLTGPNWPARISSKDHITDWFRHARRERLIHCSMSLVHYNIAFAGGGC